MNTYTAKYNLFTVNVSIIITCSEASYSDIYAISPLYCFDILLYRLHDFHTFPPFQTPIRFELYIHIIFFTPYMCFSLAHYRFSCLQHLLSFILMGRGMHDKAVSLLISQLFFSRIDLSFFFPKIL